jgi:hypothetical protein
MNNFGFSFSLKYAAEVGIDWRECLSEALDGLGVRRFRLMSYWTMIEAERGNYDFADLDEQIQMISDRGGEVTLCLGLKQPRWPEVHQPEWAKELETIDPAEWRNMLYGFISAVIDRYESNPTVTSWQLENEALIKFGLPTDRSRKRLRDELKLVKSKTKKPVIMSLSDSWGLPWRHPLPDVYAMSLYRTIYGKGRYNYDPRPPLFYKIRATVIQILTGRKVFIHELQCEPWGPTGTEQLSITEQDKSMNAKKIAENIAFAQKTGMRPIDLWGLEWWYARKKSGDPNLMDTVREMLD